MSVSVHLAPQFLQKTLKKTITKTDITSEPISSLSQTFDSVFLTY